MRHFATLALAALLLAPAAFAQSEALSISPATVRASLPSAFDASTALVEITQNSSLNVTTGTVRCASSTDEGATPQGSTANSFYRVFDLTQYSVPDNAVLNSIDYGVRIRIFDEGTRPATGDLIVSTLPAGTDVSNGFSTSALTPLASEEVTFAADSLALVTTPFSAPPMLTGSELLVVELAFDAGNFDPDEDTPRQFDATPGANDEPADGATYLGTPDCGGIPPTPTEQIGATFTSQWVVVLNVDEAGAVSPIGDARSAGVGATVTVEGTVSRAQGDFVYLQDETGGLTLRQTDENSQFFMDVASGAIAPGTTIALTGTLSEFNGLLQINNDDLAEYEITGTGDAPAPQVVTLDELATNGEAYEGELVQVVGVTIDGDGDTVFGDRTSYDIEDGSGAMGAVTLRIPNADDTEIDGQAIPTGSVTLTGVVGQFSSTDPAAGYQIFAIQDGDIGMVTAIGEDPEGRLALGGLLPNPSAQEATVTISLASAGRATLVVYDVLGREVARVLDRDLVAGDLVVRVDVSALDAGTYLARLTANGGTAVRPFTVVR
ncbi:T9SS type A sorting domain-containing protein [Rubrivirga sp. IMCC45206]|uniref:T9SS type A sorting domain-containing protein n=1 Tax=Rubrivirga sp. IMCC45206 TaxID=3391614 RepID=UPI0039902DF5